MNGIHAAFDRAHRQGRRGPKHPRWETLGILSRGG